MNWTYRLMEVPKHGWTLEVHSDDGQKMWIGTIMVIDEKYRWHHLKTHKRGEANTLDDARDAILVISEEYNRSIEAKDRYV